MTLKKHNIYIKDLKRRTGQFQFFMHQLVEAAKTQGIPLCPEVIVQTIPQKIIKKIYFILCFVLRFVPRNTSIKVIIPSHGGAILHDAYPYWRYNIIPFLWDIWENNWDETLRQLKLLKVNQVFVTVRSRAEELKKLGYSAYWIPEGIDVNDYIKGKELSQRQIDIYELGRQHPEYHKVIEHILIQNNFVYKGNKYDDTGKLISLAYDTAEQLLSALPEVKVMVCFPRSDTHPQFAAKLETLTMRYWEAMLSGIVIVGRAPQELIDIIGYNPVIDVDWERPQQQLEEIIANIYQYQKLVDQNYNAAMCHAPWARRIPLIIKSLNN